MWVCDEDDERAKSLFARVHCHVDIPTQDDYAYPMYPEYNWVYTKLMLYQSLGIQAMPHGIEPDAYPVFSKPICNMWGMGVGAKKLDHWDWMTDYEAGHLWMPVLEGVQCSTDIAVVNGHIKWHYTMEAIKDEHGSFMVFRSYDHYDIDKIRPWVLKHLKGYTGMINVECIGGVPIEVHLRFSPQFVELYGGDCWLRAVVALYEKKRWDLSIDMPRGYSYVLRVPKTHTMDEWVPEFSPSLIEALEQEGVFIQLVYERGVPLKNNLANDMRTYRLAVVNGFDDLTCEEVVEVLRSSVPMEGVEPSIDGL